MKTVKIIGFLFCVWAFVWSLGKWTADMGITKADKTQDILPILNSWTMEAKFHRACMAWNYACKSKGIDGRTRSALYLQSATEIEEVFKVAPGYQNIQEIRNITKGALKNVRS